VLPPQPFILMTMTLPGPTSAGTAIWQGPPHFLFTPATALLSFCLLMSRMVCC
jgi:hypothetical protein